MINDRIDVNIAGGLDVPLPRMVHVRQRFELSKVSSVADTVAQEFTKSAIKTKIKPGMTIAVGVGSRGVNNIAECVKSVVEEIKALGGEPFVFPAMGSHGGATAEGQQEVLDSYGVTESVIGCPIRSSMEVVEIDKAEDGMPVYMDKFAAEADAVALVCRIKPHTNFRAPIESGIVKMLTIGMGKIIGASTLHTYGMDMFGVLLPNVAKIIMAKKNFLFGVAMVENAADETAIIEIVPSEEVLSREPLLLSRAKELMPKLQFEDIDVLVVEKIGKNISGSGMDPNITGRNCRDVEWEMSPNVKKIAVLGLTPETHGNATGLGAADVITMDVYRELDIAKTYANVITSMYLDGAAIPIIMNNDREAIQLAVKTVVRVKPENTKVVRISTTLEVMDLHVSENLLPYIKNNPDKFDILGEPAATKFDDNGKIYPMMAVSAHAKV